jgi:quercetin dioxygenase-like cupin family protein
MMPVRTIGLSLLLTSCLCSLPSARAQVIPPEAGEALIARGNRPITIKVDPKTVGATQFVAGTEVLPSGVIFNTHRHPNQEELLIVQHGKLRIGVGDAQPRDADAGAFVFIPKNTWVTLENTSGEAAGFIFIFPQTGIEEFFRKTSQKAGEPFTLTPEQRAAARKEHEHDIEFRDPPPR